MIKLTKIDINPNSEVEHASTIEEYRKDQERGTWGEFFDGRSPPIEYYMIGEPLVPLEEGKCFIIDRHNRNGIEIRGVMHTSPVQKIEGEGDVLFITTANSLYKLELVDYEKE
jgi:hypothetical protein